MDMKKTGGQAFPTSDSQTAHTIAMAAVEGITDSGERDRVYTAARAQAMQGMTLRDYFAAQALTTVAAYDSHDVDTWTPRDFAHHAYALADAMIEERAK
jgi:hypothetical protein